MILFTMKVIFLDKQIKMFFFSLLDIRKGNKWSHYKRKIRNQKRKNRHRLTLSDFSMILIQSGRHMTQSRFIILYIVSEKCTTLTYW